MANASDSEKTKVDRLGALLRELNRTHDQYAVRFMPIITFNDWLDYLEEVLTESIILIALDEFEVLEGSFSRGQLCEADILEMLRNLIQHRSRFRLLLSGSNTLDKFQKWSNYLINTKVFKVGYLNDKESHQLFQVELIRRWFSQKTR
ncbi:MAG: hypothetical protein AAF215_23245 [Cyanobacteria bacterium P01_A01_bin.123]